jgi:hypothetical protein
VDWDADPTVVVPYFKGVASVIGLERTGVYGSYRVVKYLLDNHLVTWAWQTYAWSAGQFDERCQLAQDQNGVSYGGGNVDFDSAHADDFGQWNYNPGDDMTPDEHKALMDVQAKINTVILDTAHPYSLQGIYSKVDTVEPSLTALKLAVANLPTEIPPLTPEQIIAVVTAMTAAVLAAQPAKFTGNIELVPTAPVPPVPPPAP